MPRPAGAPAANAASGTPPDELWDTHRVEATRLEPEHHVVVAGRERIAYDTLVHATGVSSLVPDVDGLEGASNLVALRTPQDARSLLDLRAAGARRAVVVGGGFFGVEAADALASAGWEVSLVEQGGRILPAFSDAIAGRAAKALAAAGVTITCGVGLASGRRASTASSRSGSRRPSSATCSTATRTPPATWRGTGMPRRAPPAPMPDFANILFAGPCNRTCPFCIGKAMPGRVNVDNLDTSRHRRDRRGRQRAAHRAGRAHGHGHGSAALPPRGPPRAAPPRPPAR